jgi:malate dehydrogenase
MRVWGTDAVEAAAGELRIGPGDLVTPLARERAAERGVAIVVTGVRAPASPPASAPAAQSLARPPATPSALTRPPGPSCSLPTGPAPGGEPAPPTIAGALYRRGAPLPQPAHDPGPGARPDRGTRPGGRVIVVGAGHVGMITAARLAHADVVDELVLVDVVDGLAAGIALDLAHTAGLDGYRTVIRGVTALAEAGPADFVVVTAGRARQPGMSRSDLVSTNAAIVGEIAAQVRAASPSAVLLVVTNPLDEMTQHAWQVSGFPPERVLGMAGVLDTARFAALAALALGKSPAEVTAVALGSHGDEMVIPLSQARACGRPLTELLPPADVAALVDRARNSGAEVVGLLKQGSAFLAPGASAARMVLAMARDTGEVMPAAVLADGSYGIKGGYVGLPARLGRGGLREIVELPLTRAELADLRQAAARIQERLAAAGGAR